MDINVIYEDKDIIVVAKPFGVPSQGDKTGDMDMLTMVMDYTGSKDIGLVHRLDRPVGGVMVFGKNKKSTENLNKMVADKTMSKTYLAVVCGELSEKSGVFEDYLLKNQKVNVSKVVDKSVKGSKKAVLEYEVVKTIEDEKYGKLNLVKIKLLTGRHHQIRVQFAHNKAPLWGDNKYNELFTKTRGWVQIGLWSCGLEFPHPINNKKMSFEALPPEGVFIEFVINANINKK